MGIDGRRSLMLLGLLRVLSAPWLSPGFVHDATVSARRFYGEAELDLIARVAAPGALVSARPRHPGFSVLTVVYR